MYIGNFLQERIKMFGYSVDNFAEEVLMDKQDIQDIINDKVSFEELEPFDICVISNALFCTPRYFIDENERNKDLVYITKDNKGNTIKSNLVKGRLQKYIKDILFLHKVNNNY